MWPRSLAFPWIWYFVDRLVNFLNLNFLKCWYVSALLTLFVRMQLFCLGVLLWAEQDVVSSGKSLHVCCFGLVGFRRCLVEQGRQAIRRLFLCCRLLSAMQFVAWGWVHVGLCVVLGHLCRVGCRFANGHGIWLWFVCWWIVWRQLAVWSWGTWSSQVCVFFWMCFVPYTDYRTFFEVPWHFQL